MQSVGCLGAAARIVGPDGRIQQIERVGDASVIQVYADGFADLPPDGRRLIWHLSQAAIAGRDIYWDQRYRHALPIRDTVEAILRHPAGVDPATLDAITEYAKLLWINNGPHLSATSQKFVLGCSRAAFEVAVQAAADGGASLPLAGGERVSDLVGRLAPACFDPEFEPFVTRKTPPDHEDLLTASANNLYDGVHLNDAEGWAERYPLNSRLVKRDHRLVEEVYRIGGRYGRLLARVVEHLRAAMRFAPEPTAAALAALVRFYETGEDGDRLAYDIAWTQDTASPVDTINGFIERHLDARGVKGAWEALVFYEHVGRTEQLGGLARLAARFEVRLPIAPWYRRAAPARITARAIEAVTATGEAGPLVPFGINLPNDNAIRAQHGSKSAWLTNVTRAFEASQDPRLWTEFSWDADEAARARRFSPAARELATSLHEVIGHGSGRPSVRLGVSPQEALRQFYSTIEEARADLVALYLLPEPDLVVTGLVSAADHASLVRAAYEAYARDALLQLRRIRHGREIELDHMRGRQMIVHWIRDETGAVVMRRRDGRTFHVVPDVLAFRTAAGSLLKEVQRIKSEGDIGAAAAVVERYGTWFDERLRDEVVARADALGLRSYVGCVMPRLEPVLATDRSLADVRVSYPLDLTAQMLEYSAASPRGIGPAA